MSVKWTVTIDCDQPATLAAFWNLALGYVDAGRWRASRSDPEWFAVFGVPPRDGRTELISRILAEYVCRSRAFKVPEPRVVKNRAHLDVHAGRGRGEPWEVRWPRTSEAVERLTAAGATVIREDVQDGIPGYVVMADPAGNQFDVL